MKQQMMLEDRDIKRLMKLSGVGKFSKKVLSEKKIREEKEEKELEEETLDEDGCDENCDEETVDETINPGAGEKLSGKVGKGNKAPDQTAPGVKSPKQIPGGNKNGDKMKPAKKPGADAPVSLKESAQLDKEIERLLKEIDNMENDEDFGGEEAPEGQDDFGGESDMDAPKPETDGSEKSALKAFLQKVAQAAQETLGIEVEVQDDAGGMGDEDFGGMDSEMPEDDGMDMGGEEGGEMPPMGDEGSEDEENPMPPKQLQEAHERLVRKLTKDVYSRLQAAQKKAQAKKK